MNNGMESLYTIWRPNISLIGAAITGPTPRARTYSARGRSAAVEDTPKLRMTSGDAGVYTEEAYVLKMLTTSCLTFSFSNPDQRRVEIDLHYECKQGCCCRIVDSFPQSPIVRVLRIIRSCPVLSSNYTLEWN